MAEVIQLHPYGVGYPFGLQKSTQFTYVQMIKQMQSQLELQSFKHNLILFKSIKSQLVIQMDSFLQQDNRLLIYYHYEPNSIKAFIQNRLNQYTDQAQRDNFLNKILQNINLSIDSLINVLSVNNIQAILAVDNFAINEQHQIKFFIQPDFQHRQNPKNNQIQEYYLTEKKKIQIQLEEFLQHLFTNTNTKLKKANFIIQGNKLLFISDNQAKQISTANVSAITQAFKLKQKNTTISSQNSPNNSKNSIKQHQNSKHKFDIKNILDQKKLQKNQVLTILQNYSNSKKQLKDNENDKRQVTNYFQNNDDFNKDASFYPQEFIKDDSIAQFQGYEDQLERQLQDLKKKKYQEDEQSNKNRAAIIPNSPTGVQLSQQKMMMKFPGFIEVPTQSKGQGVHLMPSKNINKNQNQLNSSNSHQNDTSTEQKQKRKYKVTITTSHQVDVEDGDNVNFDQIQKELIEDIKKGRLKGNETNYDTNQNQNQNYSKRNYEKDQLLHFNSPSHIIKGRQTHNPSSSHQIYANQGTFQQRNTSLNSIGSNMSSSVDQKINDDKPFSKHHHLVTQNSHSFQSGKEIRNDLPVNPSNIHHHGHDIKKILQKIKTNMANQQNASNSQQNQLSVQPFQSNVSNFSSVPSKQIQKGHQQNIGISNTYLKSKPSFSEEETQQSQPTGYMFVKEMHSSENKPQQQYDKQYYEKIQKAKMKAQQIMKSVKQRKAH